MRRPSPCSRGCRCRVRAHCPRWVRRGSGTGQRARRTRSAALPFIGLDYGDDGGEIYVVKFFPRARLTSKDDEQWARSTETQRPVTFNAYRDSLVGTSCRNWVDGPGWRSLAG